METKEQINDTNTDTNTSELTVTLTQKEDYWEIKCNIQIAQIAYAMISGEGKK